MSAPSYESLFLRFRRAGDARALGAVFDASAGELGRVAGHLAGGDAHAAGDLLQSTWLTAIERAGTWDERRPLLPWLLGILANHARSRRRALRREAAATAGTEAFAAVLAGDDPLRASVDAEFARLCSAALAQLAPPFREVVTLHVQHGLSAKEIAAALGRPAGTVRTQIVRGLDRLRERLPAGIAGAALAGAALGAAELARIRDAVLARAPHAVPTAASSLSSWSLGVAVALLSAVAILVAQSREPLRPATDPVPRADLASVASPTAEADAVREPLAAPAQQDPAPAAPRRPQRRLTVHVRRADDPKIVAGEWVALDEGGELRLAATDAQGDAVFDDVAPALAHHVFLSGSGASATVFAPRLPPPDTFALETTIEVPAGQPLRVQVHDVAGRPVAGAEVEGNAAQNGARTWLPLGRTDERGTLALRAQRILQYRARAGGHAPSSFASPRRDEDGGHVCELALGAAVAPLRGRTVDENGEPVAAELGTIAFGSDLVEPWFDRTDASGAFAFDWLAEGHVALVARASIRGGMRVALVRTDVPRREPLEIRLVRGASIAVAARRADGGPAVDETVRARLLEPGAFAMPFYQRFGRTDQSGQLRLEDLAPGRWHVEVEFGETLAKTVLDVAAGADVEWTAQGTPLRDLLVRLLDERGEPLSGWRVQPFDLRDRPRGQMASTLEDGCPPAFQVHRLPPDEPVTLAVFDPAGHELGPWFPALRVPGVLATGERIDVRVPDRCRSTHFVRGRVVDDAGRPLAATVRVFAPRGYWRQGPEVATGADGAFRLGPFAPGRLAGAIERDGAPVHWLPPLDVPAVGDIDLGDVVLGPGVEVRVAVTSDGEVPAGLQLRLVREVDGREFALRRRQDGTFAAAGLGRGRYTVEGSARTHVVKSPSIEVGGDAVAVSVACERAPVLRLELPLLDDERAQRMWSGTVTLRRGDEPVLRREVSVRFHGRVPEPLPFEVAVAPGRYAIEVAFFDDRRAIGDCLVPAAGTTLLLARLP